MKKIYKYLIFALIIICAIALASVNKSFHKYLEFPDANEVLIDVKSFDTGSMFSIDNRKDKQALLDLIKNSIRLSHVKLNNSPIDGLHNTYSVTIWSKDYFCVFYVSNKKPLYCFLSGNKFDYYITGGDIIANYLDKLYS
ncbi:hypothetical protein SDC9_195953 [bioreactor metagenome]|uniref:Uncharacterized protein n=1 Tax=bioreactor metagenome TaxID=1076179 RepID=A0A645IBP4_9ZZZZ